jgi:hypothetical protein
MSAQSGHGKLRRSETSTQFRELAELRVCQQVVQLTHAEKRPFLWTDC